MKSGVQDQAEGKFHKVKGKLKELAGELSHNPKLEASGTCEKTAGIVQEKIGQIKKSLASSDSGVSYSGLSLFTRLRFHDTPQPGLRKA
jgi:uncharacterized protein YjbJ (UPF0337 family)